MNSRVLRYLAVGAFNSALCLALILGLRNLLGIPDFAANLAGYLFGLGVSFTLNQRWTFRWSGGQYDRLMPFLLVLAVAWAVNIALVLLLLQAGLPAGWAHAAGVPVYTLVSYWGCARFVFGAKAAAP